MKKIFLFIFLFLPFILNSLELTTQDVYVFKVGVVDMDLVLSEHAKSKEFQKEIKFFEENKRLELVSYEKEIEDLIKKKIEIFNEIEQLKQQLLQYDKIFTNTDTTVDSATTNLQEKEQEIQQIKNNIDSKQKNIEEIEKNIAEKKELLKQKQNEIELEIEKMKQKYEIELFANLYEIIRKIAVQEGLNIVIDKSGILYGESKIDITEKVLKMIK
ncbi:MAG: OmpH family outer membrane protein [Endomicrobiia bacterium]